MYAFMFHVTSCRRPSKGISPLLSLCTALLSLRLPPGRTVAHHPISQPSSSAGQGLCPPGPALGPAIVSSLCVSPCWGDGVLPALCHRPSASTLHLLPPSAQSPTVPTARWHARSPLPCPPRPFSVLVAAPPRPLMPMTSPSLPVEHCVCPLHVLLQVEGLLVYCMSIFGSLY
jgi:hypothetical protein